jgi:hypothetical protein
VSFFNESTGPDPDDLAAENQLFAQFRDLARWSVMLQVVAPRLLKMLHIKWLTINVVAGVAGF